MDRVEPYCCWTKGRNLFWRCLDVHLKSSEYYNKHSRLIKKSFLSNLLFLKLVTGCLLMYLFNMSCRQYWFQTHEWYSNLWLTRNNTTTSAPGFISKVLLMLKSFSFLFYSTNIYSCTTGTCFSWSGFQAYFFSCHVLSINNAKYLLFYCL